MKVPRVRVLERLKTRQWNARWIPVVALALLAASAPCMNAQDTSGGGLEMEREAALNGVSRVMGPAVAASMEDGMKNLSESQRQRVFSQMCFKIAQVNPALAFQMARDYPIRLNGVLDDLMQFWAHDDLPAALTWVSSFPMGVQRDRYMARICLVLAETQADEAVTIIGEQIPEGGFRDMVTDMAKQAGR